jgi:hypothetical protein
LSTERVNANPDDFGVLPRLVIPQGYVDKAWIKTVEEGPPAAAIAAGALCVTFHLASRLVSRAVTKTWIQPGGTRIPSVRLRRLLTASGVMSFV